MYRLTIMSLGPKKKGRFIYFHTLRRIAHMAKIFTIALAFVFGLTFGGITVAKAADQSAPIVVASEKSGDDHGKSGEDHGKSGEDHGKGDDKGKKKGKEKKGH